MGYGNIQAAAKRWPDAVMTNSGIVLALAKASGGNEDRRLQADSGHENRDHSSTFHLRIWNVLTGEMIEELLPVEYTAHDDIGAPV